MLSTRKEIVAYFNENYTELWIDYFKDKKSMKALWESINDMGINQASLSTLYSHQKFRRFSREKYIGQIVEIQNIDKIMIALNIKDKDIEIALPDALKVYEEEVRAAYNLAYKAARKR